MSELQLEINIAYLEERYKKEERPILKFTYWNLLRKLKNERRYYRNFNRLNNKTRFNRQKARI